MDTRSVANSILLQFALHKSRLDELISSHLAQSKLGSREIKQVYNLTSGVVRHLSTLDWKISKIYAGNYHKALNKLKTILRLAFFEIDYQDFIPPYATVNEYVSLSGKVLDKKRSKVVNGVLRAYLRHKGKYNPSKAFKFPKSRLSVQYAFPEWMIDRWLNEWGEDQTEQLCQASNLRPIFGLRIHRNVIDEDLFLSKLKANHVEFTPSLFVKGVYKISDVQALRKLNVFEKGHCAIQDESAIIAVNLLNPAKNDLILDACAAPGGKFTGILHATASQVRLIGLDRFRDRLKMVRENCRSQCLNHYHLVQGDAQQAPLRLKLDKIIVDAPCSGLGTIQKHPDIKWRRQPDEIEEFHKLQLSILEEMSLLLKPGGFIIYSTCTIERRENEDVISTFLARQKEFSLILPPKSLNAFVEERYYIKTLPHIHHMDGSFCVKLQRSSAQNRQ
jgi:16S rRNA (cytosine967-C5)-methyltransferase